MLEGEEVGPRVGNWGRWGAGDSWKDRAKYGWSEGEGGLEAGLVRNFLNLEKQ